MKLQKVCLVIPLLLLCIKGMAGANPAGENPLDKAEDSLSYYLEQMRSSSRDDDKLYWNSQFKNLFAQALLTEGAFEWAFDSLASVGKLVSPDKAFRIFNWNVEKSDFTQTYYALVLIPNKKKPLVIELKDMSPAISNPGNQQTDHRKWYGCLYYEIIVSNEGARPEYTLLGYDMNDRSSKKRIIESMMIQGDKIVFGLPSFEVKEDGEKLPKNRRRVIFEYSSEVQMAMKYHPEEKRIVFDHLSPNDPRAEGLYEFYFPDGSYDALELQENGKWKYITDVDVKGIKTKTYNDPRKNR